MIYTLSLRYTPHFCLYFIFSNKANTTNFYNLFYFDATCQKSIVTLHPETGINNLKCRMTMSLNYTIDCRHCGNHSQFEFYTNSRTMRHQDINSVMHIDTECAIRCPICRSKLNTSEADFKAQVKVAHAI